MPKCATLTGILDGYDFDDLRSLRYTRQSYQSQNLGTLGNLNKVQEDCTSTTNHSKSNAHLSAGIYLQISYVRRVIIWERTSDCLGADYEF